MQVHTMHIPFSGDLPADSDDLYARVPGGDSKEAADLIAMAGALSLEGDDEEAGKCYRAILERFPNHYVANYNVGNGLRINGKPRSALKYLKRAIRAWPEHPMAYACMGSVLLDLKRYERALGLLDLALDLNPGYRPAMDDRKKALRALARRGRGQAARGGAGEAARGGGQSAQH